MIDLTPLDVRNKRGDFKKILRGYDPQEVDVFLEVAAERLEQIVRENIGLREKSSVLEQQVTSQTGREQAVQEALVTAQELRADIQGQAKRESDHILHEAKTESRHRIAEAESEVRKMLLEAERKLKLGQDALEEMERRRTRFLRGFRQLLEREMDVVEVEEERPIDLHLGSGRPLSMDGEEPAAATSDDSRDGDAEADARPADDDSADVDEGAEAPSLDAPIDELAESGEEEEVRVEASVDNAAAESNDDGASASYPALVEDDAEEDPAANRFSSLFDASPSLPDVPTLDEVLSESESNDDTLAFPFDSDESDGDS
jgi:cell division initiation protein